MSTLATLHRRLGSKLSLPSLPAIVTQIQEACGDPDAGLRDVALLIGKDPPLAARCLRMVNSAYFGLEAPVVSLEHAASVLGMNAIQNLVLQVAARGLFQHLSARAGFDPQALWKHSILTGWVARQLPARLRPDGEGDELELAGLLHDIGRYVLLDLEGERYLDLMLRAKAERRPLEELERELLGFDHAQIGAVLALRWNLPEPVGCCIQKLQDVDDASAVALPAVAPLMLAHHVARTVQGRLDCHDSSRQPASPAPPLVASRLRLQPSDLKSLLGFAERRLEQIVL